MGKQQKLTGEKQGKARNRIPPPEMTFKPGQSGNPNGRPKGSKNRSTIARKVLEMVGMLPKNALENLKTIFPGITDKMTVEEIMTIKMASQAITKGDTQAYKAVMDSGYGSPSQTITGPNDGPVQLQSVVSKEDLIQEAKARGLPTKIFE